MAFTGLHSYKNTIHLEGIVRTDAVFDPVRRSASFGLWIKEQTTDSDGSVKVSHHEINIEVWGRTIVHCADIRPGMELAVDGRLMFRDHTESHSQPHQTVWVKAARVLILGTAPIRRNTSVDTSS